MVDMIVVTDFSEIENYFKAISLGTTQYISKFFRMKELKWIIRAYMLKRKTASTKYLEG